VIREYDAALQEMYLALRFIGDQEQRLLAILEGYRRIYKALFGAEPPPPVEEGGLLNTSDRRLHIIRETALTLAQPGEEVTVAAVLRTLTTAGKQLPVRNPRATIATVLVGFKSHFVKVDNGRGVFRRKEG